MELRFKPPLNWVEYMPVLQLAAGVPLDALQLQRACELAARVHSAVFDPSASEIVASLRTEPALAAFAAAVEEICAGEQA